MGSIVLGPRIGRFVGSKDSREFVQGHNPALYLLGTFLLWFAWFSFNAANLLRVDTISAAKTIARISTCTCLSGAACGLVTLAIEIYRCEMTREDVFSSCLNVS